MLSFSQIWVVAVLLCPELCVCTLCLCSLTLPGTHVLYKCQLMNVFDHLPPTSLRYTTLNPTGTSQVKDLATFLCTWSKTILGFLMHTFVNKKTLLFEWNFYQAGWVSVTELCYFPYGCSCCFCTTAVDFWLFLNKSFFLKRESLFFLTLLDSFSLFKRSSDSIHHYSLISYSIFPICTVLLI